MRTILRIVVPTDFSECSLQALDEAQNLARLFGAKLFLLHVAEDLTPRSLDTEVGMARESLRRTLYSDAEAQFAALAPRLRGQDYDTAIRMGRPPVAICKYAEEIDADLIVIATHGRSGMARLFIGSTAEEVVRRSKIAVFTIRPEAQRMKAQYDVCVIHEPHCECMKEVTNFRAIVTRRDGPIRVRDAMRRDVVKVLPETRVHEIIDLMIHHDISGVPVVNAEDELVGYVPESHLLVRSLAGIMHHTPEASNLDEFVAEQRKIYGKTAREVMCPAPEVVTVEESAPLADAVRRMLEHRVSRLPVLRAGKVVGYLTRADILRVVRSLESHKDSDLSDEEVGRLVREALDRSAEVAVSDLTVDVGGGVVSLLGSVSSAEEIDQANAIVTRVPGVKAVANCLLVEQLLH